MTTCLGKSCSFGLLRLSSWTFIRFCVCPSFPFGIELGIWDVIILNPDHCLSVYFEISLSEHGGHVLLPSCTLK